jgi:hypothetical protein
MTTWDGRRSAASWGHPSVPRIMNQMIVRPPTIVDTPEGAFFSITTLEILSPSSALPSHHRVRRAYTGLEFSFRASVIGGAYPYTYELSNAPAGMTVNARGVVTWPNPTSTATNVQLIVRDAFLASTSVTWTVTVGTSGFKFVDAVSGSDAAAGTFAAPWQTIQKVYNSAAPTDIIYFFEGTYTFAGIATDAADNSFGLEFIDWDDGGERPKQWLAVPGEARPIIDFEYTGDGCLPWNFGLVSGVREPGVGDQPGYSCGDSVPALHFNGVTYMQGLKFYRCMSKAFHMFLDDSMFGVCWFDCQFDTIGPGRESANSGFVMFAAASGVNCIGVSFLDCTFTNIIYGTANCAMKVYTLTKLLVDGCDFTGFEDHTESIALKAAAVQYTVRANRFNDVTQAIVGNQGHYAGDGIDNPTGEVCFNLIQVRDPAAGEAYAMHFNQNAEAGQQWIYRNTMIGGKVLALNVGTPNGPFRLFNNVFVNPNSGTPAGSHVTHQGVTDASRIVLGDDNGGDAEDNLAGVAADGITDGAGLLQGSYRAPHLGRKGHEIP